MNKYIIFSLIVFFSSSSFSYVNLTLEQGPAWQSRNEFNISGTNGTRVDLAKFDGGTNYSVRLEGRWQWTTHHAVRLLFAPYTSKTSFRNTTNFIFLDHTFSANQILNSTYKFNSYRVSYIYTFNPEDKLRVSLGLTAKIRDANITLSDGVTLKENPNLGFVPLIHFEALWKFHPKLDLALTADALAAPQGRAEDILLKAVYQINESWRTYVGYRTLEGGANNDKVYTFAWLHYAVLGLEVDIN